MTDKRMVKTDLGACAVDLIESWNYHLILGYCHRFTGFTLYLFMALNSLCADVPLRNYSLTHDRKLDSILVAFGNVLWVAQEAIVLLCDD